MGGFQFQESHPKMVKLGLLMSKDDILPNHIDIDIVEKSSIGIRFKGGQKIVACVHIKGSYSPLQPS
jgi:hypothetical protein